MKTNDVLEVSVLFCSLPDRPVPVSIDMLLLAFIPNSNEIHGLLLHAIVIISSFARCYRILCVCPVCALVCCVLSASCLSDVCVLSVSVSVSCLWSVSCSLCPVCVQSLSVVCVCDTEYNTEHSGTCNRYAGAAVFKKRKLQFFLFSTLARRPTVS